MEIPKLHYGQQMTVEEAGQHYEAVQEAFAEVRGHYSGLFSRFKKIMSDDDRETLDDCIAALGPIAKNPSVTSVHSQLDFYAKRGDARAKEAIKDTLYSQAVSLEREINGYMSRFRNTGVILFGND